MTESQVEQDAKLHAKAIRAKIAADIINSPVGNPSVGEDEICPLTIFMAGAPGAGKTEASKEMLRNFNILRVDPDDFREHFPGYTGSNSRLFQGAVSLIVERVFDKLVRSNKSFLLDGTSANLSVVRSNIKRALKRNRCVRTWYVYQDPVLSWEFVQAREITEGRGIPLESFIDQYFNSRFVIRQMKEEFADELSVDVLVKNFNDDDPKFFENVSSVDAVCPSSLTREQLATILMQEPTL